MKLLVDTHVLLWWLEDDGRLGSHARDCISDPANIVLISDVSLWEIAIKSRIGKLKVDSSLIEREAAGADFTRLAIRPNHIHAVLRLPDHHRDPFDHLIIAQAIIEDATLVTADRRIGRYQAKTMVCS
ncbi:type II toxin-antitoxin system VapC family toxin [Sphingomonas gilva]|uniref:Type II toxin-antitoxin system VapC family toxin n=1 Tax=Sphingomonas gilva TaxID=2305907 RepID=A0A396RN93_9SPHN|nr:type II toxin-antitoxin system VapC family toxin [Sphingomonas gilva]RHW17920.1 type II toxin-antitoxin system VapC family toxin [Sphingomonas gilva]